MSEFDEPASSDSTDDVGKSEPAPSAVVLQAWDTAIIAVSGLVAYISLRIDPTLGLILALIPAVFVASAHVHRARDAERVLDTSLKSTAQVVSVFLVGLLVSVFVAVLFQSDSIVWLAFPIHGILGIGAISFYRKRRDQRRFKLEPRVAVWYPDYTHHVSEDEIRKIIDRPIVGHYQNSIGGQGEDANDNEGMQDLVRGYRNRDFDELLIHTHPATKTAATVVEVVSGTGIPFRFIPVSRLGTVERPVNVGVPTIQSPMSLFGRATKRVLDIVLSVVMLIVTLPLFLVLGILIPATSPGAAIFRQQRVGKDGKRFTMYKFRSMRIADTAYGDDPKSRITRIGRMLRKTSLDEIPQFINVLKGDMSIIGPRPEMTPIVERYTPVERARLMVLPGISGVWQLSPYRGCPIHENVHCDLFYIRNQSVVLDIVLMFQTLFWAFRGV